MTHYQRMGEWLISAGLITRAQLDEALRTQRASRGRLGEVLTSMGWVSEEQVLECLSSQYCLPIANLEKLQPEPAALRVVSMSWSLSHLILPTKIKEHEIEIVASDPIDVRGTDEIYRVSRLRPRLSLATPTALFRMIPKAYSVTLTVEQGAAGEKEETVKAKKPAKVEPQKDRTQLLVVLNENTSEPSMWSKLTGS